MSEHKPGEQCLHCGINRLMDMNNEQQHLASGKRVDVAENIETLLSCTAELLAMYPDAKHRKAMVKDAMAMLQRLTRNYREAGRYPGGSNGGYPEAAPFTTPN